MTKTNTADTSNSNAHSSEVTQRDIQIFLGLVGNTATAQEIQEITNNRKDIYTAMTLEIMNFIPDYSVTQTLLLAMTAHTGQDFGFDTNQRYQRLWNQASEYTPGYAEFKAALYRNIDPKFETYFADRGETATIRLDEIRRGGVRQDGIPPLREPKMLQATEADYLEDDNIVFGIEVEGEARAYPKRILARHEMFVDTIAGVPLAGVYCTLCGTVVLYETIVDGIQYELGTSGFLYRSNKLMYDKATQSMWNTIKGEPVLGPLVGKGIVLTSRSVVTTTRGEWKRRHPDTLVLSLDTGHRRDYGEGVAYQDYFGTDDLMFNTPFGDRRLPNKREILALRFPAHPSEQLAIDTEFLKENTIYYDAVGDQQLVVITDDTGANRVYDPEGVEFVTYDGDSTLIDTHGQIRLLTEHSITSKTDDKVIQSLPYHRSFWFGWHATYPESRLVK